MICLFSGGMSWFSVFFLSSMALILLMVGIYIHCDLDRKDERCIRGRVMLEDAHLNARRLWEDFTMKSQVLFKTVYHNAEQLVWHLYEQADQLIARFRSAK